MPTFYDAYLTEYLKGFLSNVYISADRFNAKNTSEKCYLKRVDGFKGER